MVSGGARFRSGPSADPSSLRQASSKAKDWVTLPVEGFQGEIPAFPLAEAKGSELELWAELWRKPQAIMWDKLGLKFQVAAYVRTFLEAAAPGAVSGVKTAALRMEAEIGLSLPGMHGFGWKFSEDELALKRAASVADKSAPSARERWASIGREG